jgi:hypothetical protein
MKRREWVREVGVRGREGGGKLKVSVIERVNHWQVRVGAATGHILMNLSRVNRVNSI